ncbi:AAA family ATPase [Cyanothece sp. BG0011]|uniref:AAA family ATPase n=2 Tax=Cyanothece sp. BG0011 TaxID=2082950 RepID=UPI0035196EB0
MMTWKLFEGNGTPKPDNYWPKPEEDKKNPLPPPPTWRDFSDQKAMDERRGRTFQIPKDDKIIDLINAALYLRRPLLVEGEPGSGKSSLAYAVAYELGLGEVLKWSITTRSTLTEGLYYYDAIGRLRDTQLMGKEKNPDVLDPIKNIGNYITLGPLGTAFLPPKKGEAKKPRVLLIDEIDKSDIDLPDDLLQIFEEGRFEIPELKRIAKQKRLVDVRTYDQKIRTIENGFVPCEVFPFVVLTSNGKRDFPPAFLRRCLRIQMKKPTRDHLENIVKAHFDETIVTKADPYIKEFLDLIEDGNKLAIDQLLNTIFLLTNGNIDEKNLKAHLLQSLDSSMMPEDESNG